MMLGPVQVLVMAVSDPEHGLELMAALRRLGPESPVRLLDAFVVEASPDGSLEVGDVDGSPPPSARLFGDVEGEGMPGTTAEDDVWHLGEAVPPGSAGLVALLEHRWAVPLRDVLVAGGGGLAFEAWLDADDRAALEELLGR